MASPTLDDIYDACGRLDEASGEKKADDYALFIDGAKSIDAKVKKLSAQMIVRYWKNFTEQRNLAFYSLVSILEDRDPETRKAVIRELSQLVKTGQLVDKFADVLSQMLQQTDDAQEMSMLTNTLAQFLKSYPKDVLSAVFVNIIKSEDESVRIRLLKFISGHLNDIPPGLMDTDLKSLVEDQFREIMKDVTAAEFDLIFELMRSMGAYQSAHGRAFLCKMVFEQIGMDRPFPAHDVQRFDQILYFVERAQKLFSPTCRSTDFAEFLISKGFPTLHEVTPCLKNRLLRAVAQVAPYAGTLDESTVIVVFEHFLALIPLLPSEQLDSEIDDDKDAEPQLKLSELEAVGLTMYALLKTNKNVFLSLQEQKEHYSNWPKRVLYLAGLLQQYITSATGELKALREASSTQRDREKMQFLVNALKMAENVYKICKDIVHSKPTFSLILTSSWKKSVVRTTDANPEKRKASDSSLSGEPKGKKERPAEKYYVPPGGKYSGSMTGFARGGPRDQAGFHGGRGRPRGFGRFGRY